MHVREKDLQKDIKKGGKKRRMLRNGAYMGTR